MRSVIKLVSGLLLGIICFARPLCAQNAPYTLSELVGHVRAQLAEARILALARQRCLGFTLDSRAADQLREAGASAQLVRDLRAVCRRPQTGSAATASAVEATLSVDELFARGDRRSERGDYAGALRDYRQAISRDGSNARAHARAAHTLSILDRNSEALTAYQRAASLEPTVSDHHSNMAAILNGLGRYQEAEGHAREAVRLDRGRAPAHYQLGLALKGRGQLEAARQSLAEAVRIAPGGVWQISLDDVERRLNFTTVSTRASDVPELNGFVESVQFYSSPTTNGQRVYRYRLRRDSVRSVAYEIRLRHPTPLQRTDFEMVAVFHWPEGGEWFRDTLKSFVLPTTGVSSTYTRSRGFDTPGRWQAGTYTVDFLHQGERVASSAFELVDAGAVDIPAAGGRVTKIQFFETEAARPSEIDRRYKYRFSANTSRYLSVVVELALPARGQRVDLPLQGTYYAPDGREIGRIFFTDAHAPQGIAGTFRYTSLPVTYIEAGKWAAGRYRVEVTAGSQRIVSGWFDMY